MRPFTTFPTSSFQSNFVSEPLKYDYIPTSYYNEYGRWPGSSGNSGLAPTLTRSAWFPDALRQTSATLIEDIPHPKDISYFSALSLIAK